MPLHFAPCVSYEVQTLLQPGHRRGERGVLGSADSIDNAEQDEGETVSDYKHRTSLGHIPIRVCHSSRELAPRAEQAAAVRVDDHFRAALEPDMYDVEGATLREPGIYVANTLVEFAPGDKEVKIVCTNMADMEI